MLAPYVTVLRTPGARAFVLAGFVGRLPMSMIGLGTVLLVSAATGSYGVAGAVSATLAVTNALSAVAIGRLVDRFGQRRVLRPALVLHAAGIAGLLLSAWLDAPYAALFACAAVAGIAFPAIGAFVRARWAAALGSGPRLQTAFAFESVLDEVVFSLGPVLATVLATSVAPAAGLIASVALSLAGGFAFAAQHATEPPVAGAREHAATAVRTPGLVVLAVVLLGIGGVFGTIEVAMVAFAQEHGHKALSGPLLALHSVASGAAGIAYGARAWSWSLDRRLRVALPLLFLGTIPLALADSIGLMVPAIMCSGLTISPTLIASFALVEELVPRAALTEGFAWISTSLGVGIAIGLAIAGHVVDAASGHVAFRVAIAAAALAAIAVTLGRRTLAARPAAAAGA